MSKSIGAAAALAAAADKETKSGGHDADELFEEIADEAYECVERKDRKGFGRALRLAARAMRRGD